MKIFLTKTNFSLAIPLAIVALAQAAPAFGQEADNGSKTAIKGVEQGSKAAEAAVQNTAGSATAPSETPASESAPPTSPAQSDSELEVTADRIPQPLPTPDAASALPRIDLHDMRPWNWDAKWHASDWANGNSSLPWRYGNVRQGFSGRTHFILDHKGGAELKAQRGHPALRNAMYEVDVTVPAMRPGLLASPLTLWNNETKESIAMEVVGQRGLAISIHRNQAGARKSEQFRIPGDFSGRRMTLAIRRHTGLGKLEFYIDGEEVHAFDDSSPAFPVSQLRPIISLQSGDVHGWQKNWLGSWAPLARGDKIDMVIHGYRVSTL